MSGVSENSTPASTGVDRSEGFGERLLGTLIERAHEMPPHLIAPLVAELIAVIGGRDVAVMLQDYDQLTLLSLPGRGLMIDEAMPIDGSLAGRAFLNDDLVEQQLADGVRLFLPLLDGTDRVGVMAFTADRWDDDDRRLGRRFAGLLAEVLRMTQYSQFAPRQPWPTTYPRSDERPDPGRRLVEGRSAVRSGRPASTRQIDGSGRARRQPRCTRTCASERVAAAAEHVAEVPVGTRLRHDRSIKEHAVTAACGHRSDLGRSGRCCPPDTGCGAAPAGERPFRSSCLPEEGAGASCLF